MGPLADGHRKRVASIADTVFSFISSFSPTKKPKLEQSPPLPRPPQPVVHETPSAPSDPPMPVSMQTLRPKPSAFSSRLHAPQPVVRAFRLGAAPRSSKVRSVPDEETPVKRTIGLQDYVKLVSVAETSAPPPRTKVASDNVVVDVDYEVEKRPVEDDEEMAEAKDSVLVMKKDPWKVLLEASKRNDGNIRRLEFEMKVEEEKRISLWKLRVELDRELDAKPKEEVLEVFVPLTEDEEVAVSHAFGGGKSREVLVSHEPSGIVITRGILQCLEYGAWLNDEVINLYLELLKEREQRDPKKFLNCHFFNTFFYKKLTGGYNGYDYKSVKRWTTQRKLGYELMSCDKIFVPIHKEVHWCLAVINIKDKKLQYLDSLGGIDNTALRLLARYLTDEAKDKSSKQIDVSSWKQEGVPDLPLQENGWDCGMFMLKYIDFYSRGMSLSFRQGDMQYFRKRTAKEILKLRAE